MGAGAVRIHTDGVAIVDALLAVMPAVAHCAVRGHRGPVHVTLPRGVCADRSHYRGVAIDHLTGKYRLVLAQVAVVERHCGLSIVSFATCMVNVPSPSAEVRTDRDTRATRVKEPSSDLLWTRSFIGQLGGDHINLLHTRRHR